MRSQFRLTFVLLLAPLVFLSCQDNDSEDPKPTILRVKPTVVANAGLDHSIYLPQNFVTLNGGLSTVTNGSLESYTWSKISGPPSSDLESPKASHTMVRNLEVGKYLFELKVTAWGGVSATDTVSVIVNAEPKYEHWTRLEYLSAGEFFFGPSDWFGGANFLMGIGEQTFAISNKGNVWQLSGTNTWQMKGVFPEKLERIPLVFSVGNRGYCLRGASLWQYTPGQNTWERKKEVPEPIRDAQVALVLQNRVYLVSGSLGKVMSYDPVTDTYSPERDYPDTGTVTGFVVNGKGYCVEEKGTCWELDPTTGTWRQKASLPYSINRMTGFSLNNYGYVLSDLNNAAYNEGKFMRVWQYDPIANQWKEFVEPFPGWGVYEVQAVTLEGRVLVGLGYNNADFPSIDLWQFEVL